MLPVLIHSSNVTQTKQSINKTCHISNTIRQFLQYNFTWVVICLKYIATPQFVIFLITMQEHEKIYYKILDLLNSGNDSNNLLTLSEHDADYSRNSSPALN